MGQTINKGKSCLQFSKSTRPYLAALVFDQLALKVIPSKGKYFGLSIFLGLSEKMVFMDIIEIV